MKRTNLRCNWKTEINGYNNSLSFKRNYSSTDFGNNIQIEYNGRTIILLIRGHETTTKIELNENSLNTILDLLDKE